MQASCEEIKRISRENLCGHYHIPMMSFLVVWAIFRLLQLPFRYLLQTYPTDMQVVVYLLAAALISLIVSVLEIGMLGIHLSVARGKECSLFDIFCGFRNQADRYLECGLIRLGLFVFALFPAIIGVILLCVFWNAAAAAALTVLCIVSVILVILAALQTQLLFFLALEEENLSIQELLRASGARIKGHRGRLLRLYLGFFGMLLLCGLSFGIGLLWFIPYEKQTLTNFYLDIAGELPKIRKEKAQKHM